MRRFEIVGSDTDTLTSHSGLALVGRALGHTHLAVDLAAIPLRQGIAHAKLVHQWRSVYHKIVGRDKQSAARVSDIVAARLRCAGQKNCPANARFGSDSPQALSSVAGVKLKAGDDVLVL